MSAKLSLGNRTISFSRQKNLNKSNVDNIENQLL